MTLASIQAAVVATLAPLLTPIAVEAHGGQFTERELPMLLGKAPCVLIAITGVRKIIPLTPTQWTGTLGLAAYCLGKDGDDSRAEQAMDLAEAILNQLLDQQWGYSDDASEPPDFTQVQADNLYTGHVNNLRIALWAVSWLQDFTVTTA